MADYRQRIYKHYRSSGYASRNSTTAAAEASRLESYHLQFGKLLPKRPDLSILDLGCGSGFLVKYLLDLGYSDVQGVDASEEQVRYARERGLPVVQADALEFAEANAGYDVIFATDMIEHLHKPEIFSLITAIHAALRPGGRLIMRTDNASSILGSRLRYMDFTHEVLFTEDSLAQVLYSCGFSDVEVFDTGALFGLSPRRFARWLLHKVWRQLLILVYLIEVGETRPRLMGKYLIARAAKSGKE